jgi:transcriptional regulator with XRE-family HTH domain
MNCSHHEPHHFSDCIALGRRLRHWRSLEQRKISEVALQIGVSTATWGHWETGEHLPGGDMLLSLSKLTGMPIHMLFCPHIEQCPHYENGTLPDPSHPCCQRNGVR